MPATVTHRKASVCLLGLCCISFTEALRLYGGHGGRATPHVSIEPISIPRAAHLLRQWVLEMKYNDDTDVGSEDGLTDIDTRVTDDSLSGPFRLVQPDADVNEELLQVHHVIQWMQRTTPRTKKAVFVAKDALDDDKEQALAFFQTNNRLLTVNGYIVSPHVDEGGSDLRAALALELLNLASSNQCSITFLHE